jgi:uncharacterized protein (TIGR02001 family)
MHEGGPRYAGGTKATVFHPNKRELIMLTSVRSLLAATLLAGSALTAAPAFAQDEEEAASPISISGNVALTSDYRFRGISLSAGDFALQGGIDLVHESGVYVGAWASSIQGGTPYGEVELDIYAGWSGMVAEGVTVDAGLLYYIYPTTDDPLNLDPDTDYFEPYASVGFTIGPVGGTVGAAYAWDQDSLGGSDNLYLYTDWSLGIPNTPLTFNAHLGYTDGVLAPPLLAGTGDDTGLDWSLGVTAAIHGGLSGSLTYVGVEGPSIDGFTDDAIVATLSFAG